MSNDTTKAMFCRVSYWKKYKDAYGKETGLIACRETDDWDRCDIGPVCTYSSYGTKSFQKGQEYERDALIYLLHQAFEAGERAKLRQIQCALGIP